MEWRICDVSGRSAEAWLAARNLCVRAPHCAGAWICQANSLRGIRGAQAAADLLFTIADQFPSEPIIPYNLACYWTELGDFRVASEWLLRAFDIDQGGELRALALIDPDLKALWEDLGETFASAASAHAGDKRLDAL
jgi:hypothetical protein